MKRRRTWGQTRPSRRLKRDPSVCWRCARGLHWVGRHTFGPADGLVLRPCRCLVCPELLAAMTGAEFIDTKEQA